MSVAALTQKLCLDLNVRNLVTHLCDITRDFFFSFFFAPNLKADWHRYFYMHFILSLNNTLND